jgi:hypothetical protein
MYGWEPLPVGASSNDHHRKAAAKLPPVPELRKRGYGSFLPVPRLAFAVAILQVLVATQ